MCIENTIVSCLAEMRDCTVQELFKCVSKKWLKVSLPNFYKIISRMVDNQVLVKTNGSLQIHTMYIHYIIWLATNLQKTYYSDNSYNVWSLAQWEHKTFNASSLYDLDVIRMDILWQLIKAYPWEEAYYYNSHPYHILSMQEKEQANLAEIGKAMNTSYFLFGNNTFLDRYGSELLSMQGYTITCTDNASFPEEGYMINIIGDYMIECSLPSTITQHYKIFFDSVNSLEEFNAQMFSHIIKMKDSYTLKIIHSPEHAKKMKQKIRKHFV